MTRWTSGSLFAALYAESSLRRRARRRARTFCPAFVRIRARKPCLRLRLSLLG